MDRTKIEARTKQMIREALKSAMYDPSARREENRLRQIIDSNRLATNDSYPYFKYKGEMYTFLPAASLPRYKNNRLMPELHESMDELLADRKLLHYTEMPFVVGYFNKVLNLSNSITDYYRLLPESIHPALDRLTLPEPLPSELSDEVVAEFRAKHNDWIQMLKKRMFLDLITT